MGTFYLLNRLSVRDSRRQRLNCGVSAAYSSNISAMIYGRLTVATVGDAPGVFGERFFVAVLWVVVLELAGGDYKVAVRGRKGRSLVG